MARCTKEDALETRNRLLDAAETVFHAQGVGSSTLADVAQHAGLTRGAIYWHFKNKADLFNAMCERVLVPMEQRIEAGCLEARDDPLGCLRAHCIFFLQQLARDAHVRTVFDILLHKCEYIDQADPILLRHRESHRLGRGRIEHLLREAVAHGQLPPSLDISLASTAFHASLEGLLKLWLFAPESVDLARDADRLVDAYTDLLRLTPSLREPSTTV